MENSSQQKQIKRGSDFLRLCVCLLAPFVAGILLLGCGSSANKHIASTHEQIQTEWSAMKLQLKKRYTHLPQLLSAYEECFDFKDGVYIGSPYKLGWSSFDGEGFSITNAFPGMTISIAMKEKLVAFDHGGLAEQIRASVNIEEFLPLLIAAAESYSKLTNATPLTLVRTDIADTNLESSKSATNLNALIKQHDSAILQVRSERFSRNPKFEPISAHLTFK